MNSSGTITCQFLCCLQSEVMLFLSLNYSVSQGTTEVKWLHYWGQVALYSRILYLVLVNFITGENHRLSPHWSVLRNQGYGPGAKYRSSLPTSGELGPRQPRSICVSARNRTRYDVKDGDPEPLVLYTLNVPTTSLFIGSILSHNTDQELQVQRS